VAQAALESPYAGVRRAGLGVLQILDPNRWQPIAARNYGPGTGSKRDPVLDMVPDVTPDAAALHSTVYPGSAYSFLVSGVRRSVFVTDDPPDRVVAFYAQGRQGYTRPELEAAIRGVQQPDPAAIIAYMAGGGDARKLGEEIQQAALAAPDVAAWASGIEGQTGVVTPRYVPIEERSVLGKTLPVRVVIIFADRALGKTAIVFPRDPLRGPDYGSRDAVQDRAFARQLFSRPLPAVEGPDPTR
jgi:hypothetical protein